MLVKASLLLVLGVLVCVSHLSKAYEASPNSALEQAIFVADIERVKYLLRRDPEVHNDIPLVFPNHIDEVSIKHLFLIQIQIQIQINE